MCILIILGHLLSFKTWGIWLLFGQVVSKALLLDHPTPGDFWDGGLPVWGEGGVEDWAVRRGEARALSLQREAVVEDFWVAP